MENKNNKPAWLDSELYPFQPQYFKTEAGNIHYVDEGEGDVILFLHGTPTWSFLYRSFIKTLSEKYRCVALDHLGFGLSDKPLHFEGTPEAHAKNLLEFIEGLDLQKITLVVHDFGGPIGLGAAFKNPDRFKNIIAFNTWLWETKNNTLALELDGFLKKEETKKAYLEDNYSVNVLLPNAFAKNKIPPKNILDHYRGPFPDKNSRQALYKIGLSFVGSSDWYQAQWNKLNEIKDKNWLFLWGMKDPYFSSEVLNTWLVKLPEAKVERFQCGHFIQEEETQATIHSIQQFLTI